MEIYEMGEFIREARKRKGYTQEELCFGICTHGNLSKIENGRRVPEWKTFEALMERLDMETQHFMVFLGKEEMEWHDMKRILLREMMTEGLVMEGNAARPIFRDGWRRLPWGDPFHKELRRENFLCTESLAKPHPMIRQLALTLEALRAHDQGESREKVQEQLWKALHLTAPNWEGQAPSGDRLYTDTELLLMLLLSRNGLKMGKNMQSLKLLKRLKQYMEGKRRLSDQKARIYTMVMAGLSEGLHQMRRYQDSASASDTGIEFCIRYGYLTALPTLLSLKGRSLAELGRKEEARYALRCARVLSEMISGQENSLEIFR